MEQKQIDLVMHSLTKQQYDNAVAQDQIELEQLYLASQPAFAVSSDVMSQFQRMMDKIGEYVPPVPPPPPIPYDAEIQYLENQPSDGIVPYINTLIIPTSNTKVEAKFNTLVRPTYGDRAWKVYFGVSNGDNSANGILCRSYATLNSYVNGWFCNASGNVIKSVGDNTDFTVVLHKNEMIVNGTSYSISTTTGAEPAARPMYLLNGNFDDQGGIWDARGANCKVYYFKMYDGDTLVCDMIPVRKGNVGYMYDRVRPNGGPLGNGLFGNSGDGQLICGPDVV